MIFNTVPGQILSYTWANRPAASTMSGRYIRITDIDNSLWQSDGTNWYQAGLAKPFSTSIPIGIAPTGTMANNGVVTLGTALNNTYSSGIYLYFPANAIVTGSAAGFYWTVMSSTTVGTVFNNTYVPANGTVPVKPTSTTSFVTTGPGAFTGVTTEITAASFLIPGGSLGINGFITNNFSTTVTNTAGTKTLRNRLGGTQLVNLAMTTGQVVDYFPRWVFSNRGDLAINVNSNWLTAGLSTTANSVLTTINTANDLTFTQTLQLATATDVLILEFSIFEFQARS